MPIEAHLLVRLVKQQFRMEQTESWVRAAKNQMASPLQTLFPKALPGTSLTQSKRGHDHTRILNGLRIRKPHFYQLKKIYPKNCKKCEKKVNRCSHCTRISKMKHIPTKCLCNNQTLATIKHILTECKIVKNHRNYIAWKLNKIAGIERDGTYLSKKKYSTKYVTVDRLIGPAFYLENQKGLNIKEKLELAHRTVLMTKAYRRKCKELAKNRGNLGTQGSSAT
mmetsp:Transcript_9196/g.17557  ORF Transcript_9196/g.17557 Transcript_9196/m.17557 type:complete len:223 (-) Transcript_9196:44-712(-)